MPKPTDKPVVVGALRRKAELLLPERDKRPPPSVRESDAILLSQELQVHQIELEMQNEELRRAQRAVEISRERYFDLYDLAPVGYFTISVSGLILEANLTAADLLHVARGVLPAQPFTRFILPADQDIHYLSRKKLLETGQPQACELRMLPRDAAPFWVQIESAIAKDADGDDVCRVVISDITARKRLEDELRKAKEEAERANTAKSEFLANMKPRDQDAHERDSWHDAIGVDPKTAGGCEGISPVGPAVGAVAARHHQRYPRLLKN